ncbi:MAG: hypothetical protein K2Q10_08125 [Rhodospirillales bacterium]|nr:hypothetical protein [Rhodospirillales bacterium]
MDWIETWLGFSPDNGDGSVETLIVEAVLAAAVIFLLAVRPKLRAKLLSWLPGRRLGQG